MYFVNLMAEYAAITKVSLWMETNPAQRAQGGERMMLNPGQDPNLHILEAIRELRRQGIRVYLWRIARRSGIRENTVRAWMDENGLSFVRSLRGQPPGHCHEWQIVEPELAGPAVRELFAIARGRC
jgi:hypothetical protein